MFTDTGTTKDGENLYQFTHRTFLEYFTAAYLDRTNRTPDKLLKVLLPKIAKQEWDVVAQLAFQLQNKGSEEAGDELLTALIEQAAKAGGDEQWNLLYFAARCLEFIVPSPKITRDITTSCVERCLAWGTERMGQATFPELEDVNSNQVEPGEVIVNLLDTATENRTIIADTLEKLLVEIVKSRGEINALLALEIGLHLDEIILRSSRGNRSVQREEIDFWKIVSAHIFEACAYQVKILCQKSLQLCIDAFRRGQVSISNVIELHSVESLFQRCRYTLIPHLTTSDIATILISIVLLPPQSQFPQRWEKNLQQLEEVGHILLHYPPAWLTASPIDNSWYQWWSICWSRWRLRAERLEKESVEGQFKRISTNTLFGAFALVATILEATERRRPGRGLAFRRIEQLRESRIPFFIRFYCTFIARFEPVETDKVQAELDGCGFTPEQQAFVWRWVRGETNLVEWTEQEEPDELQSLYII